MAYSTCFFRKLYRGQIFGPPSYCNATMPTDRRGTPTSCSTERLPHAHLVSRPDRGFFARGCCAVAQAVMLMLQTRLLANLVPVARAAQWLLVSIVQSGNALKTLQGFIHQFSYTQAWLQAWLPDFVVTKQKLDFCDS